MKRGIISLIVIAVIILAGVTLTAFNSAPGEGPNPEAGDGYVVVKATEIYGTKPSSLVIIYEDGNIEEIQLNKLDAKKMGVNLLIIQNKLNEIKGKGYKLVSSHGGNSDNIICSTYIFEKE